MGRKKTTCVPTKEQSEESKRIVAYTCRLGSPLKAIRLREFEYSLDGLKEKDALLLRSAFVSLSDIEPRDGGKESEILRRVIFRLRDELKK